LRKSHDVGHINIAELDAVLKGVNLALKWKIKVISVMTDSATVLSWLRSVLEDDSRVKVSGMSEMLVRRRLSTIKELVDEYGLEVSPTYVKSCVNKADELTRVNKLWLKDPVQYVCSVSVSDLHEQHHFGIDRSLYLARMVDPNIKREEVEKCVRSCWQCHSIDPAPARHSPGKLSVEENWKRLAIDVTHYGQSCYLSLIDCGPSRFTIWRKVRSENAADVSCNLHEIFLERGPPDELLMDNSTAFRSKQVGDLCREWNVSRQYRAAYRPSGNGIVERVHRTIKSLAARSKCDPLKVVFWYNLSARDGLDASSAPCNGLHAYSWRHPSVAPSKPTADCPPICVGEQVIVKPKGGKCTSRWSLGTVTGVTSANNVDVDGVPRHILDIRKLYEPGGGDGGPKGGKVSDVSRVVEFESDLSEVDDSQEDEDDADGGEIIRGRPVRRRKPPSWLADYELQLDDL
ncbi:MAG: DDE-type integrase/transposase/recombinase, partial [Bacteroidota bacterium]